MKCILIHRPGLLGTLAYIRRTAAQSTWIFKDTLGLFHLTSQREWSGPLSPHSCLIALSPTLTSVTLLHFKFSPPWFVSHCLLLFFFKISKFFFVILTSHICLLSLVSAVPQHSEATEADEGMSTCLSPSAYTLPSQRAASVWRRLRCGRRCGSWFFFCSNHSQRTDYGLIWVFTARPYFSHQWCECLLEPSPLHFWSNLHHMPLKGDEPTGRRASL